MRTFITTLAALAVAAALLAGCAGTGSGPTPAPSPSPPPAASPSAAAPSPSPSPAPTTDGAGPEHVVGMVGSVGLTRGYETSYVPGGLVKQLRNGVVAFTFELNDPRVTGTGTWGPIAVDIYEDSLGPEWGPFTLANAGGIWTGSCSGGTWSNGDGAADACWLVGKGGYAGWTFSMQFAKDPAGPGVVNGIIYPGAPPAP